VGAQLSAVNDAELARAIAWLRSGGVVAFPTDTFYGLAVDPRLPHAVTALFEVKGRDPQMAVPLIAASLEQACAAAEWVSALTERLALAFWPGPLSLIVDAAPAVCEAVHGGRRTIAIRVPDSAVSCRLAEGLGFPITATSANLSGAPPVRHPKHLDAVARDPRVLVLAAGDTPGGAPSTIVDARGERPTLVRAGAISFERVLTFLHG
jgi:L-threonylcarbamoyladenylate synthase